MKRASIFFKINLLFAITFGLVLLIFIAVSSYENERQDRKIMIDAIELAKTAISGTLQPEAITQKAERLGFSIQKEDNGVLLDSASLLTERNFESGYIQLYEHDAMRWVKLKLEQQVWLLKQQASEQSIISILWLIFLGVIVLLGVLYGAIRRTFLPLRTLTREIQRYGEGAESIHTASEQTDEIAMVGNEFQKAVEKIQELQAARTLFLRNIMHELKTPITKGRIGVQFIEEGANRNLIEGVFLRLEQLIEEMAEIEKLNTRNLVLASGAYRIQDLIDNAAELLFLEPDSLHSSLQDEMITGDFKLLSIVFKNLIDNALKYSPDKQVSVDVRDNQLRFCNTGEPLQKPFAEYIQPFFKELHLQDEKNQGFGLGLYIAHEILTKHDMTLQYCYTVERKNCFFIQKSLVNSR